MAYGGGAGTLAGQSNHGNGLAVGGRRGMSAIAWHPDNATRLVTASEDDSSPIIMVWDLRNARAPEKVVSLHLFEESFSDRIPVDPNWPRKRCTISFMV